MKNQFDESYFVHLPLVRGLKILADTRLAYRLYFWCVGRITAEYRTVWGVRCGAVLGLSPQTDRGIAADIARYSQESCGARTVRRWRGVLALLGLLAWRRTPLGVRIFVVGSEKMPESRLVELPEWAEVVVAKPVALHLARYPKTGESGKDQPLTPKVMCTFGGSSGQGWPVRVAKVGHSNIRLEVDSEKTEQYDTASLSAQGAGKNPPDGDVERQRIWAELKRSGDESMLRNFEECWPGVTPVLAGEGLNGQEKGHDG